MKSVQRSKLSRECLLLACFIVWCHDLSCSGAVFSLRVDGREIPVFEHRVRGRLNCAYAHFTVGERVEVAVKLPAGARSWTLSPLSLGIPTAADAGVLRFHLAAPRYLVLTVDGVRLLLLADPPPPLPGAERIIDVTSAPYAADASGVRDATASLQRALDHAGALGSNTVVHLPPGTYTTTGVKARSHTQLHLAKGAVLQGSGRAEDYVEYPKVPGKTGISALIRIEDAKHVRVFGHGTVDARGFALAGEAATIEEVRLKARCFTIERSQHVTIEGVICREATSWTLPFFHCSDVAVRRVKVINDLGPLEHSDGIDLCATQRGVVEDCLVHTTDDAFCAKGHEGAPTEDLVFRRLVALSATRGLKCGMQAYEPMRRIRFEDVDIVQTRDGIDLMHWDGFGAWQDISFKGIRVESCERRSVSATVREGGSIAGVRFEDVQFAEARPGFFRGKDATQCIDGIVIKNLRIAGRPVITLKEAGIATNAFTRRIRFATKDTATPQELGVPTPDAP